MQPDLTTILTFVALIAVMYFLMIRPQQKKNREQAEQQASLEPGTRVMLTSGIYGTIIHVGSKQMVLEVAPGTELTVIKQAIHHIAKPEEDEFEYADDASEESDAEQDAPDAPAAADPSTEGATAEAVTDEQRFREAISGFDEPSEPATPDQSKNTDDEGPSSAKS